MVDKNGKVEQMEKEKEKLHCSLKRTRLACGNFNLFKPNTDITTCIRHSNGLYIDVIIMVWRSEQMGALKHPHNLLMNFARETIFFLFSIPFAIHTVSEFVSVIVYEKQSGILQIVMI